MRCFICLLCSIVFSLNLAAAVSPSVLSSWRFEPNRGQVSGTALLIARRGFHSVVLKSDSLDFGAEATIELVDANRHAIVAGERPTGAVSNYLRGSDESGWVRATPQFSQVRFREVYPRTD